MATYNYIEVFDINKLTRRLLRRYNSVDTAFVLKHEYGFDIFGNRLNTGNRVVHRNAYNGGSKASIAIHSIVSKAVSFPVSTRESVVALMLLNVKG